MCYFLGFGQDVCAGARRSSSGRLSSDLHYGYHSHAEKMPFHIAAIPPCRLKAEISSKYPKSLEIRICFLFSCLRGSSEFIMLLKINLFAYLGRYMAKG